MSLNIEPVSHKFVPETPVPQTNKLSSAASPSAAPLSVARRYEARSAGDNLRLKLEKQLDNKINASDPPSSPYSLTAEDLEQQQDEQKTQRNALEQRKAANDTIIQSPDSSIWDKIKAFGDNLETANALDRLATESKITNENLSAVERGDKKAIAFFDAMNQTNATGDPWDMNPGDAFRNSLNPAAQKVYDETLAKLRNDPRVQFEFGPGTVDNLAFREIALRGIVAATFGRPQDLEARIAHAADTNANGKFTITFRPDNYVGPDGSKTWGARANGDGIEAKQGFTVQQIANLNDNLFIHEFSHVLQAGNNLPPEFGLLDSILFPVDLSSPALQKYLGSDKITVETFPTIQNHFRQDPEGLKKASPEMYKLMVDYSGFDPLTGSLK